MPTRAPQLREVRLAQGARLLQVQQRQLVLLDHAAPLPRSRPPDGPVGIYVNADPKMITGLFAVYMSHDRAVMDFEPLPTDRLHGKGTALGGHTDRAASLGSLARSRSRRRRSPRRVCRGMVDHRRTHRRDRRCGRVGRHRSVVRRAADGAEDGRCCCPRRGPVPAAGLRERDDACRRGGRPPDGYDDVGHNHRSPWTSGSRPSSRSRSPSVVKNTSGRHRRPDHHHRQSGTADQQAPMGSPCNTFGNEPNPGAVGSSATPAGPRGRAG